MLSNIGVPGLIIILVLALIIFGPNKLPEIGRAVGNSLREFKKATNDITSDIKSDVQQDIELAKKTCQQNKSRSHWVCFLFCVFLFLGHREAAVVLFNRYKIFIN